MIKFIDTTVTFEKDGKEFIAVNKANLEVNKGDFFGIIGSSGAGKSTLVRTVNLLQKYSSGKVVIDGQDITNITDKELRTLRKKIGMIFQHFNLIKNSTVIENVAFALKATNTPKSEIYPKAENLLSLVGLLDKKDVYPASLSGGQKQRVAIARALANSPEILLCDEATSALDPDNTKEVVQTLKDIKNKYPITILFITHQMEVAKNLFDKVAIMDHGKVVEVGDSYQIFSNPTSKEGKRLIYNTYKGILPKEVIDVEKQLYVITYKLDFAYQPLIAEVSKKYTKVNLSILAGNIEYIQGKPLGRLVISLHGDEKEKLEVLEFFRTKTYVEEGLIGETNE